LTNALPSWRWRKVTKMGDHAKQDKPFELNRYEFGVFASLWDKWKERNPERLQEPMIKALNERLEKHWAEAYRCEQAEDNEPDDEIDPYYR